MCAVHTVRPLWGSPSALCGIQTHPPVGKPGIGGGAGHCQKLPPSSPHSQHPLPLSAPGFLWKAALLQCPRPLPSLQRTHLPVRHILHDDGLLLQVLPKHLQNPARMEWEMGDRPEYPKGPLSNAPTRPHRSSHSHHLLPFPTLHTLAPLSFLSSTWQTLIILLP